MKPGKGKLYMYINCGPERKLSRVEHNNNLVITQGDNMALLNPSLNEVKVKTQCKFLYNKDYLFSRK